MDAQRIEKIRDGLNCLRKHKRRTVVMPATLYVGAYEFRSMLYDISLGGVRMKLDLPLARGAEVKIRIKDKSKLDVEKLQEILQCMLDDIEINRALDIQKTRVEILYQLYTLFSCLSNLIKLHI